ncbi:MAG: DUF1007 family protein [Hyphomicrobiales bacterium]|nr:DUF1007 family protein [Hyphomicrobiales bacterium]
MIRQLSTVFAAALAGLVATTSVAFAHPHVWVTMRSELVYAPDGTVTGIRHAWAFDDMFSAFATQGIESKKRGVFTREELAPLAKTNVESLKDFDYFTVARLNGKKVDLADPASGYFLDYKDQILTLHFTLPFKAPVRVKDLQIEIYDPSYFVDFSFDKGNAVALVGAPAGCKLTVVRPEEMDPALAAKLSQIGPDQKLDPSQYLGAQFASRILVKCS